jgi:putative acetyltransferase
MADEMTVRIDLGSPIDPQVARMLAESDRYYADLYPAESNHLLELGSLIAPNASFFVARYGATIMGFGALLATPPYGEVKRMYVDRLARGRGIGRDLLKVIERSARDLNLISLRLETGIYQPEAISLYRKHGFREIAPFGNYKPDPLSLFLEKSLT